MDLKYFNKLKSVVKFAHALIGYDPILPFIEKTILLRGKSDLCKTQPIFIVGAPRTGSTLLFELLISTYRTSYITNLSALLYKSPVLATKLIKNLGLIHTFSGTSKYGYIQGLSAPSEAGVLFKYWFGHNEGVQQAKPKLLPAHVIRMTIDSMCCLMEGPFIAKNLSNSVRLQRISQIFPNALFFYIKREPVYTAQSIILARRKLFRNDGGWFSVKPQNYETLLELDPFEQVIYQIMSIENYIEQVLDERQIKNVIEIWYENMCSDWHRVLKKIAELCANHGVSLQENQQPSNIRLRPSEKQILDDREWGKLCHLVNAIYNQSEFSNRCRTNES